MIGEDVDGHLDLVDLSGSVDDEGKFSDANADDLDCVLVAQRIPDDDKDVQEAEDEESEECRNGLVLGLDLVVVVVDAKAGLELAKDVSLEAEAQDSLNTRDSHEGSRPSVFEERHLGAGGAWCRGGSRQALAMGIAAVVVAGI